MVDLSSLQKQDIVLKLLAYSVTYSVGNKYTGPWKTVTKIKNIQSETCKKYRQYTKRCKKNQCRI